MAEAKTKAAKEKKEVTPKVEKNGIVRPKAGTLTEKVWVIADQISAKAKAPAGRKEVIESAVGQGINKATASTQYGRWRTFNGVKATPKPKTTAKPKAAKK